jgi:glycosyltransferase involved in cell wall biosynthesis
MQWTASSKLDAQNSATVEFSVADLHGYNFIGAYAPKAKIQFYGPFGEYVSMGNVSTQICHELTKQFDDVAIHNFIPAPWIDKELERHAGLNTKADIAIFLGTPDALPDFFFDHPISIGGFVCETDTIDPNWVITCNKLDLVFVPTQWCKDAFFNSGVTTPIIVLPHGIEPEYKPVSGLRPNDTFVFFNTFHSSSYCSRKSLEELVRCFLHTFSSNEKVVLKLRTDKSPALTECMRKYNFSKQIQHVPMDYCSTENFAKLYSQVHCTVHPSKGEGFGLIPFQSIACETPVIAPHSTGMADYLRANNSIEVKTKGRIRGEGVGNSHGTYFRIDENDLQKQLRYVFENWQAEKDKVAQAGPAFRAQHAWSNVLKDFISLLDTLLDTPVDQRLQKLRAL